MGVHPSAFLAELDEDSMPRMRQSSKICCTIMDDCVRRVRMASEVSVFPG